ncbi:MerR family transcriptional regulator [uncultured Sphingomonas sp.]|uniref:MerR family transcriptional regulator n=1 Tax=uncultured Sphingomonas sp. TaxID=158754 RepID=UPI0025E907E7|nr:MerR family transcriptional regulator [uncultured Sphingomonas sp.]
MRIGELARRTGVSVRMLRYYEAEELLSPERTSAGYRDYPADAVGTVETIRLLGQAGMTLPVIRHFLPCTLHARGAFEPCDELRGILLDQLAAVDQRMASLKESRNRLESILSQL